MGRMGRTGIGCTWYGVMGGKVVTVKEGMMNEKWSCEVLNVILGSHPLHFAGSGPNVLAQIASP